MEKKLRKYNDAVRAAVRRMAETEEQRQARTMKDRARKNQRRSMETGEQRRARLEADRARMARRRMIQTIVKIEEGDSKKRSESCVDEDF